MRSQSNTAWGFTIGAFGMFGNNVDWDISIVTAYNDSVPKTLTEKGLGWCCCELYNIADKHIVLLSGNRRIKAKRKGLPPAIHRLQALSAA